MQQRIGIFGGTFDPIHLGHLILAEQCREQARLDQVWFVPAARPPHKLDRPLTRFDQRVEMIALAIAGQPAFRIDELEKDRPGPSYTADTLHELHTLHSEAEFWLLIGSDTVADLPQWHAPQQIVEQAGLVVTARPGHPIPTAEEIRGLLRLPEGVLLRYQTVESPLIDLSSRDLRRRAHSGRSLRYFVPRAVECYIHEKRLYATEPPSAASGHLPPPA
jgi:nicotinate-nucleotide adenylyltransferase